MRDANRAQRLSKSDGVAGVDVDHYLAQAPRTLIGTALN